MLSSLFNKENKRKEMRNKKSLIISGKKHKKKLSLQNNKGSFAYYFRRIKDEK